MLLRIRATNRNKKLLILIDISDNCFLRFGFNFDPIIGEREREREEVGIYLQIMADCTHGQPETAAFSSTFALLVSRRRCLFSVSLLPLVSVSKK